MNIQRNMMYTNTRDITHFMCRSSITHLFWELYHVHHSFSTHIQSTYVHSAVITRSLCVHFIIGLFIGLQTRPSPMLSFRVNPTHAKHAQHKNIPFQKERTTTCSPIKRPPPAHSPHSSASCCAPVALSRGAATPASAAHPACQRCSAPPAADSTLRAVS